ncbi:MAG: prepilin peptidase [Candidatus Magasanikbacteria bacterium]|nr:prepilin peptidase [Candidatus Magasanikbacteria bacterium]
MEYIIWYIWAALLGASMGSFVTMLVHRLHEGTSIVFGGSKCFHCHKKLGLLELIPVLSFLLLRGKCKKCGTKIPLRYFLIELVTTILFVLALYKQSEFPMIPNLFIIRDWIIVTAAVFIFAYDALYMEVHPRVTIGAGVLVGLMYILTIPFEWKSILFGIVLGVGWFLFQYVVSKGRWIGAGDIMIGFFMGASLGLSHTILALGIAYVVGASYAIALLILKKKNRKDQIPFGTFLMIGTVFALLWGNSIVMWYLHMVRLI